MATHFEKFIAVIVTVAIAFSAISAFSGAGSGQASSIIITGVASGSNIIAEGCWLGANPCSGAGSIACLSAPNCKWANGRCNYIGVDCRTVSYNDCTPGLIGGCTWYECIDNDRDGAVYTDGSAGSTYCISRNGLNKPKDCDDGNPNVRACRPGQTPKAAPACSDGDSDGYGKAGTSLVSCQQKSEDCDDNNYAINPGAKEICDNEKDDDCDMLSDLKDNDCATFCVDKDGDGYGAAGTITNECRFPSSDCADDNYNVNPGAQEIAGDGVDNDCEAKTPDVDFDKDGYAYPEDCNDQDASIKPKQLDFCDGVDSNCDGSTSDEDCITNANCGYFGRACTENENCEKQPSGIYECAVSAYQAAGACQYDSDSDGWCGGDTLADGTRIPSGQRDCDDSNKLISPGTQEVCKNSKDDNCNSQIDEQPCFSGLCQDADQDGYGAAGSDLSRCSYTSVEDCDDNDIYVKPGLDEICDGKDNNCNGQTDEDVGWQDGASYAGPKRSEQGVCYFATAVCKSGSWQWDYGTAYQSEEGMGDTAACNDGVDNDCDGKLDCLSGNGEADNGYCNDYCALLDAQTEGQTGGTQGQGGGAGSSASGGTGEAVGIPQINIWQAVLRWLFF